MNSPARRALLIDDEPLARMELKRLLTAHAQIEIVAEGGTLNDARCLLSREDYDLVFLDVQLRGGTGFDLLDSLNRRAQVVFVTAHDRFAFRAFEVNAIDFLLKPVAPHRLAVTLRKLLALPHHTLLPCDPVAPGLAVPARRLASEDRVLVKSGFTSRFVLVSSICAIRSNENYSELLTANGEVILVLSTLKSWIERLPETVFMRVHRQALVNLRRVAKIERDREHAVMFHFDAPVPPVAGSRRRISELRWHFRACGLEGLLP